MIETLDRSAGNIIGFRMSEKLHDEDYKTFVPQIDKLLETHPKIRLLACFEDFHGWDMHAMWDDIKFATTHCTKVDRIAIAGDRKWEEWMAKVCKPFTMAKIQYFDSSDLDAAWRWLEDGA